VQQEPRERIERLGNGAMFLSCLSALVYLLTSAGLHNTLGDVVSFVKETLRRSM
jgi:hypothetical protein